MERDVAERLMAILVGFGEPLNEAAHLIEEKVTDEREKRLLRHGIAEIMGKTAFPEIMFMILRQYPDLDPDKGTDWLRELHAKRARRERGELD